MSIGFSMEAAKWLIANRNIAGIGTDSMCVDNGQSLNFEVHVTMSEDNKFSKAFQNRPLILLSTKNQLLNCMS